MVQFKLLIYQTIQSVDINTMVGSICHTPTSSLERLLIWVEMLLDLANFFSKPCPSKSSGYYRFVGKSYFIYHNGSLPLNGGSFRRSVCIDYLYYNKDVYNETGKFPNQPRPGGYDKQSVKMKFFFYKYIVMYQRRVNNINSGNMKITNGTKLLPV